MTFQIAKFQGLDVPCMLWMGRKSGPCLNMQARANDPGLNLVEEFRKVCYQLPKTLHWFHQGGCLPEPRRSEWHMFEFWVGPDREIAVLEACMKIADQFGLDLDLELNRTDMRRLLFTEEFK